MLRRLSSAIKLAFYDRCIRRVQIDLSTTREHLADAEESYRVNGPFAQDGLAGEIVHLRQRETSLFEELSYVDWKRASLLETDCGCAPTP